LTDPEELTQSDVADRISVEIASIHRESYGEDVDRITTHVLDDAVLCLLDVKLLPHERTLLAGGRGADSIRDVRTMLQTAMEATFVAAIEHQTGRRVIGFLSSTHLDPPFEVEFFRLAPSP
jgi:uncharacterized protein YbcI